MKRLLIKVFIIIFSVFFISLGIDNIYRRVYHLNYELPNNIFIFPEIKDKYEIVKLGNSHAGDGIIFDRYKLKSLSLTGSAQSFDYDLAYLKMYSQQIKKGALIIITVSPIAFSQEKAGAEDSLQTNYYDGRISPFLIPNINIGDYLQNRIFPFLRSGYLWREKNTQEIQKRISEEEKWLEPQPKAQVKLVQDVASKQQEITPSQNVTQNKILNVTRENYYFNVEVIKNELTFPTSVAPNLHEKSMNFMFNKWYSEDGFGKQYFDANRRDLEELIKYCLKMKWRPVMITIPITQVLLKGLNPNYMQVYVYDNIRKTSLQGTEYFDFIKNTQLTKNSFLFSNSDHLNRNGAAIFSYILLRRLINRGYLPNEADQYDYSPLWKPQD